MARTKSEQIIAFTKMVSQLHIAYRQFIQAKFKEHRIDLTFEMLQVMVYLWQQDGINQQEIADVTMKDKASMTCLIDNLGKRELVSRQEDGNDRRNKLILLTPKGKELKTTIQPIIDNMYEAAGKDVTASVLQESMIVLKRVTANLLT